MEERCGQVEVRIDSNDENAVTIAGLRKNWTFLSNHEDGGKIYQTPKGKFLLEENEDGSLKRLQLIDE